MTATIAVAATIGLTAGASQATGTTFSLSVGAHTSGSYPVAGSSTTMTFFDITHIPAVQAACASVAGTANMTAQTSVPYGTTAGTIPSSTWTGCRGKGTVPITVTQSGSWSLHVTDVNVVGGDVVATVYVDGISASISSTVCSFTATGSADGTISNNHQTIVFAMVPGSPHKVVTSNTTGCPGLVANGDQISVSGTFALSSPAGAFAFSTP